MAGTWQGLVHQPNFLASTMLLLTDGTVMCHDSGSVNWWRLRPDGSGSYTNGQWSRLAPMKHTRLYYASAVLADGRVIVAGGEYSDAGDFTNAVEIYNPPTDTWTSLSPPVGWEHIGDGPCAVLPDGRFLIGNSHTKLTAFFDPHTNAWSDGPSKLDLSSEESWVLLADGSVVTAQCQHHPGSEQFVPSANAWLDAGNIPVDLVEDKSREIGAGVLLPAGRAFFIGATGQTALYTPHGVAGQPGQWDAGPAFPKDGNGFQLGAKDAPACLLPNGRVLCVAGPVDGQKDSYLKPTFFFEFDGSNLSRIADPPNATDVPYLGRMLLLPTGQVLFAAGTAAMHVYSPDGAPDSAWRPQVTSVSSVLRAFSSATVFGRQLNGLSQAVGYGDDAAAATNYPLVRLRHLAKGTVMYCRTTDHSSMGVATGASVEHTNFAVPFNAPDGSAELTVIANGIASDPVNVTIHSFFHGFPWGIDAIHNVLNGLTSGPLSAIGSTGLLPIKPWSPETASEAEAARRQLKQSLKTLQRLGSQAHRRRASISQKRPRAVDEEAEAAKNKAAGMGSTVAGKSRITKKKTRAKA